MDEFTTDDRSRTLRTLFRNNVVYALRAYMLRERRARKGKMRERERKNKKEKEKKEKSEKAGRRTRAHTHTHETTKITGDTERSLRATDEIGI